MAMKNLVPTILHASGNSLWQGLRSVSTEDDLLHLIEVAR